MTVVHWRKGAMTQIAGAHVDLDSQPFGVIDPGSTGMSAVFPPVALWDAPRRPLITEPIYGYDGGATFASRAFARGVRTLIVEETFAREGSPQSAMQLARTSGYAAGAFAGLMAAKQVGDGFVVWCPAASWAAVVLPPSTYRTDEGKIRPMRRAEKIAAMLAMAAPVFGDDLRWTGATKLQKEALASVLCIAMWWAKVRRRKQCDLIPSA